MVARSDGSFLMKRNLVGRTADAERMGQTLGTSLYADAPADVFD
jgi:hydroxymethylbilane synthase